MTKSIVFDAGPVISLTTNNLLWILEPLKNDFDGLFYIPEAVKDELIDKPLRTKKFKFEALQVLHLVRTGVLEVVEQPKIKQLAHKLLDIANHIFKANGNWVKIVHYAEMEVLATAISLNAETIVIDERTTRLIVESPHKLLKIMSKKLHSKIVVDEKNLNKFSKEVAGVKILRSVELVVVAYEKKLLNKYLVDGHINRKVLVESLLWGVKLHGCAVSRREIDKILEIDTV